MGEFTILSEVVAAASRVFEKDVTEDDDFFELGSDSVAAIELLERLEDRFEVELDPEIVYAAEHFGDLAKRIGRLRPSPADGEDGRLGA